MRSERITRSTFEEIRKQPREDPGILAGTSCLILKVRELAAQGALILAGVSRFPGCTACLVGCFILGLKRGGFQGGAIFTGVFFALLRSNAGLWDKPRKRLKRVNRRAWAQMPIKPRGWRDGWRSSQGSAARH